ncbi:MAG: GMP reductase [Alphaproteobacteria bacterium]|nr:GMP reductase [Alphaproteobacteria bacterium]
MKIEDDVKLDFADVLIRPKRSNLDSRSKVDVRRTFKFQLPSGEFVWHGVPIVAANMDTVGTFEMAHSLSEFDAMCAIHKYYTEEDWDKYVSSWMRSHSNAHCGIIYTMGMGNASSTLEEIQKAEKILNSHKHVRFICLDVANGYTEKFVNYVRTIRGLFPNHVIIAGNVVTREMTEALILAGANIIKAGIGPGSVCTTRKVAGVGYPQLSCIMECADAAHGLGGYVLSDGGCTCPGDVAKAFGAGADFVMIGGMFAGTDEAAGKLTDEGKEFYGMSSAAAMEKHSGGVAMYRAAEGKRVFVKEVGPVASVMQQILGGVRSACTYVGASKLKYLSKCTTFVRVNRQLNNIFQEN